MSEFLLKEFEGSSLAVRSVSEDEVVIEADSIIRIHVRIDDAKKEVNFDLFSPRWSRRITVQQLNGFEFMESQAEELLEKDHAEEVAEDSLLALDMIRIWADQRNYSTVEVAPSNDVEANVRPGRRP